MRHIVRTPLIATAVVVALALAAPAASASVTQIDDRARDPELTFGSTARAADLYRFQGADRVQTALAAAQLATYSGSGTPLGDVALLASSTEYADALASAPLAEALSAPVLLADANGGLSAAVATELEAYDTVIIASGAGHIPQSTAAALRADGATVVRYAGSSRFDTAAALGLAALYWESVRANDGRRPGTSIGAWTAYLADGLAFPDGLSAGPAAARDTQGVLLLTAGAELGRVSGAAVQGRFADIAGAEGSAIGPLQDWWTRVSGTAEAKVVAVGAAAAAAADAAKLPILAALAGEDRYATAALVARYSIERGTVTNSFAIASGETFPDAVVAGAFAANIAAPLLLTRATALPRSTTEVLEPAVLNNSTVAVFGGEATVSRDVSRQLIGMLTW